MNRRRRITWASNLSPRGNRLLVLLMVYEIAVFLVAFAVRGRVPEVMFIAAFLFTQAVGFALSIWVLRRYSLPRRTERTDP